MQALSQFILSTPVKPVEKIYPRWYLRPRINVRCLISPLCDERLPNTKCNKKFVPAASISITRHFLAHAEDGPLKIFCSEPPLLRNPPDPDLLMAVVYHDTDFQRAD